MCSLFVKPQRYTTQMTSVSFENNVMYKPFTYKSYIYIYIYIYI